MEQIEQRYAVFAYNQYYPSGGWADFRGTFLTLAEAWSAVGQELSGFDYHDVVDLVTMKLVDYPRSGASSF